MREFEFVECDRHASTPNESFSVEPPKQGRQMYNASTEFSLTNLGEGDGRKCLVIGSPVFVVKELSGIGWDVTYMDVREPPIYLRKFIQCDATKMTLPDECFDAIETSCVLSHAGMGRYGDPLVQDGDEKMLKEMFRVMKPGTAASIMFGNVASMPKMVVLGTCHRIYTMKEAERLLDETGFVVENRRVWSLKHSVWLKGNAPITEDFMSKPDYLSVFVRKPT